MSSKNYFPKIFPTFLLMVPRMHADNHRRGDASHEHTQHPAHTGCQSTAQPKDSFVGPAADCGQTDERDGLRGIHQDSDRECAWGVTPVTGTRARRAST